MTMHIDPQDIRQLSSSSSNSLASIKRGIEKESLRADSNYALAQSQHPSSLGSALCNSWLTTDFSEALIEFVTPTFESSRAAIEHLNTLHQFAIPRLDNSEILWPSSLPCILPSDNEIPLARFGSSNSGQMKTAYRRGLGHRYGRAMQTVAGIHYNFSLPQTFWEQEYAHAGQAWQEKSLQEYINFRYLALIRNFRRSYWLLIYLFGASPVADPSFAQGRAHTLDTLSTGDIYKPYATSLRMGDLGYQSKAQESLFVCYNQLDSYLTTLRCAIKTTYPPYSDIGVKVDGEYQQLSDSILQIENEFYSPIRPKRVTQSGQTPANALTEHGIEYIEVRCLDLDPFEPSGISEDCAAFLDTFLVGCLMADSPLCDEIEFRQIADNQKLVVDSGRLPGLKLKRRVAGQTQTIALQQWSEEILEHLSSVAELLDDVNGQSNHSAALKNAAVKISDPTKTPSAQVLATLQESGMTHIAFAGELSKKHQAFFANQSVNTEEIADLASRAKKSLALQLEIESADTISFDEFLKNYFLQ